MKTKNQTLNVRNTLLYSSCVLISIIGSSFLFSMLYKKAHPNLIRYNNAPIIGNEWLNVFTTTLLLLWAIFIITFQNKSYIHSLFFIGVFLFHLFFFTSWYLFGDNLYHPFVIGFLSVFQCVCLTILIIQSYREFNLDIRTSLKRILLLILTSLGLAMLIIINITHIWRILTTLANYLPVPVSPAIVLQLTILIIIVATSKIFTKIKLRELSLFNMKYLFQGVFVFVLISIFIQFTQICNRWFIKGNINWIFHHSEIDIKNWIHSTVEFFLVGFHEDLLFRVVIFLCLYKWLIINFNGKHQKLLLLSVLLSQIIFSLYHFPLEIIAYKQSVGILIEGFLGRLMVGLLLLFAYIRTRNLYVPIFIHLLNDFHTPLFYNETSMLLEGSNLVRFYSVLILIFWPKLFKQAKPYFQSEELPLSYNKDKIV